MSESHIDVLLKCLDNAGAGICPLTGGPLQDPQLLSSRVAFYDLAKHIRMQQEKAGSVEVKKPTQQGALAKSRPPANSGKPWTDEDISVTISMFHDRFRLDEIGQKIHRSAWSVANKLNQLGEMGDEAFERLRVELGKDEPSTSVKNSRKAT